MYMIVRTILTYYGFIFTEWIFHRIGHIRDERNYIYRLHITHHKVYYPINRLLSDTYESGLEGVLAYLPPSLLIWIILYLLLDFTTFTLVSIQLIIHAFLNDYIHTQIHISDSWLERYRWFQHCRRIHFIHHKKLFKNLAFGGDFTMDKLSGTYQRH